MSDPVIEPSGYIKICSELVNDTEFCINVLPAIQSGVHSGFEKTRENKEDIEDGEEDS